MASSRTVVTKMLMLTSVSARGDSSMVGLGREVAARVFALEVLLLLLPEEAVGKRPRLQPSLLMPRTQLL